jgi:hypothetical protein
MYYKERDDQASARRSYQLLVPGLIKSPSGSGHFNLAEIPDISI